MNTRRGALTFLLLALLPLTQGMAEPADPTAPSRPNHTGQNPGQHGTGWALHSTLVGPERRGAVINGQRVQVGDRIDGARVARIEAGEVLLDTPERRITLRLLPNPLRIHARE
jgi:MSHA biogenesis protein MshK